MTDGSAPLIICLLGSPEARIAETPLVLNNQKARGLLYCLPATG